MQVEMDVRINDGTIIVPAGLPGYDKTCTATVGEDPTGIGPCVILSIPELQLQLRLHDYYMGTTKFKRRRCSTHYIHRNESQLRHYMGFNPGYLSRKGPFVQQDFKGHVFG